MARKSARASGFRNFVITCSVLIVAQVAFLAFKSESDAPLTPRDSVSAALSKMPDMSDERRERMRIQLALADYKSRNGQYPNSLNQLIPEYLDSIPNDPATNAPIVYAVNNGRYRLGTPRSGGSTAASAAGRTGAAAGDITTVGLGNLSPELLAELEKEAAAERASFVYDPTGKRDPFMPFDLAPKISTGGTELEQYQVGQLRYTSFLGGAGEPIALVENANRKGFTIRKGTKIGPNGGVVIDILPTKILILESAVDPITGETKNTTLEMELKATVGVGQGNARQQGNRTRR